MWEGVSVYCLLQDMLQLRWSALAINMQYLECYRGTGGLTQIFVGAAWEPVKNFSAGVNVSYLFGSFSRSSVVIPVSSGALVTEDKHSYSIRDLKYDFGWQYQHQFDKNRSVTISAVNTPSIHPKADLTTTLLHFSGDPYENPWLNPTQENSMTQYREHRFNCPRPLGWDLPTPPAVC